MILLCEADEITYRCAFACQKQAYRILFKDGTIEDKENQFTKTELIKKLTNEGYSPDEYELKGYPLIDHESIVYKTVDEYISVLMDLEHEAWGSDIDDIKLWLSPSDKSNFRHTVANLMGRKGVGYKEGRGPKPYYLGLIRDYLVHEYGAREIPGFEADDALGIYANDNTILSHQDKDMNMIEGWHVDHVTLDIYYIEPGMGTILLREKDKKVIGRGLLYFYVQLLTGDTIDNIPACLNPEKAHHKKAPYISDAIAFNLLHRVQSEKVAFNIVKELYGYTYKDNWKNALEECADLLWICRKYNETGRQYLKNRGFIK